jgi:hypothetical protein
VPLAERLNDVDLPATARLDRRRGEVVERPFEVILHRTLQGVGSVGALPQSSSMRALKQNAPRWLSEGGRESIASAETIIPRDVGLIMPPVPAGFAGDRGPRPAETRVLRALPSGEPWWGSWASLYALTFAGLSSRRPTRPLRCCVRIMGAGGCAIRLNCTNRGCPDEIHRWPQA